MEEVAEVDLRENVTFHRAGFIFESKKLHGLALFGAHHLACDEPAQEAYLLTGHCNQDAGREGVEAFSGPVEEHDGVMGAEKNEDAVFVAQSLDGFFGGRLGMLMASRKSLGVLVPKLPRQ